MISGLPEEEYIAQGSRSCSGCGPMLGMRLLLKAAGKNTILVIGTGCMEVVTTPYPYTSFQIPTIHNAFENTAATASGVEAALKFKGNKDTKVLAIAGDGGCYTPKTKILTTEGFKNVGDLDRFDTVLSVNPRNLNIEPAKIIRMHEYSYRDKIVRVNHNFVHFDVSLNHNIPVYNRFTRKVELVKAHELLNYGRSDKVNIITGNLKWKGKGKKWFTLPAVSKSKFGGNKISENLPIASWLGFFGYWVSEGHLSTKSSKRERYNVYVSQTKKSVKEKIKTCLSKLPYNFWYSKDRFIISNQQLWSYLRKFGKARDKYIPQELKELPVNQLKVLFDALVLGDGHIIKYKGSKTYSYSTISKRLNDDFIEIALKLGLRVHLDIRKRKGRFEYSILASNYKPTMLANLRRSNISSYYYEGKIYCPELEKNHILIIEKDGRVSLNMNSFDIGLQALSGMIERGHNVCYVCYDNEGYQNTGNQRSGATTKFASTTTTPYGSKVHGKVEVKKPLPFIIAAHRLPYMATANIAFPQDLYRKVKKALHVGGPTYIQLFTPCNLGWKFTPGLTVNVAKLAVETNFSPLYEVDNGLFILNKHVDKPKPVSEYLKLQGRFKNLTKEEVDVLQKNVDKEFEFLKGLENKKLFP